MKRKRFVSSGRACSCTESICGKLSPSENRNSHLTRDRQKGNKDRVSECRVLKGPSFAPAQRSGDCESQVMEAHVPGCIHASRAFHASSQIRLIWPLIVPPLHASARSFNLPLPVTVSVAILRDRTPRGHSLVITTCSRGTRRTSVVLVVGGSSECGLLLEQPSVLIGGPGGD